MPRFAANIGFLYQELPLEERFQAASEDGFHGIEYQTPYEVAPDQFARWLTAARLQQVLINTPAGGSNLSAVRAAWAEGWRGTASLPGEQAAFEYGIELALEYAQALDCPRIHVLAGIHEPHALTTISKADRLLWLRRLEWAAERAARSHLSDKTPVCLLLEAINHTDMPGYWLHTQQQTFDALNEIRHPHLAMQLDFYHCQMTEGDPLAALQRYLPTGLVQHTQIAGAPGRHEPNHGALPWQDLMQTLDEQHYSGWVGLEYRPHRSTRAGLEWRQGLHQHPAQ